LQDFDANTRTDLSNIFHIVSLDVEMIQICCSGKTVT